MNNRKVKTTFDRLMSDKDRKERFDKEYSEFLLTEFI